MTVHGERSTIRHGLAAQLGFAACLISFWAIPAWAEGNEPAAGGSDSASAPTVTVEVYTAKLNGIIVTRADRPGGDDAIMLQLPDSSLRIRVKSEGADASGSAVAEASAALKTVRGNLYALVGNNGGIVSATDTRTINGHVWLTAPGSAIAMAADDTPASGVAATPAKRPARVIATHAIAARSGGSIRLAGID